MIPQKTPLRKLNLMNAHGFARVVGPVFEHSPWVAERAFAKHPFKSMDDLHAKLVETMKSASDTEKLALLRAHPDLVGRMAQPQQLTEESKREQAAAGLDRLSSDEREAFQTYNAAYHEQFGFPFIICAREHKKEAILTAFPKRLKNPREKETATALDEIAKIARLRLIDLIEEH